MSEPVLLLYNSQAELDAHYVTFGNEDLPCISAIAHGIDYVRQVRNALHGVKVYRPALARSGDFRVSADIAWTVCTKLNLDPPDGRPTAPMAIDAALAYIERVLPRFHAVERPDYWDWCWEGWIRQGKNIIEMHLVEVKRAWQADTSGTPQERARKFLSMVRTRFQFMHDLCEVPRDKAFDYGHVAQVAHGVVADVLPTRPPAPEGRRSFTNLLTDLDDLEARLDGARVEGAENEGDSDPPDAVFITRVRQVLERSAVPIPREELLTAADLPVGGRSYGKLTWMADNGLVFSGPKGFALKPYGRKPRKKT